MQEAASRAARHDETLSHSIIRRLRAGGLPQMVDWFDPMLLAKIGVREMVSGTMGQYADQRLMQAATDDASEQKLRERYDYSGATGAQMRYGEGLWVDYISDLGDGFEATYAMAYLMAQDRLDVQSANGTAKPLTLPAGEILIMGGDQAYPQSSPQEYQDRLLDPYNWAFSTPNPQRKLFALPGNHDWYDGLGAFDSLFCSVRNLIAKDNGKPIGGWRCQQHRSYWAIKLSEHWWIWGADIQLEGTFDDAQRDYFHIKSEQTGPGDNIIICLAEPSWVHDNYDNLHDIAYLARKHGAHVSAVLAGDWHHYSRYEQTAKSKTLKDLGLQFITCGGGGAFAHATHGLKDKLTLRWPDVKIEAKRGSSGAAPDLTHMGRDAAAETNNGALPPKAAPQITEYGYEAAAIYPTKGFSRLLSLKNLWLPFHNWRFAVFVGLVYYLFAWVFSVSINDYEVTQRLGEVSTAEGQSATKFADAVDQQTGLLNSTEADVEKRRKDAAQATATSARAVATSIDERAKVLTSRDSGVLSAFELNIQKMATEVETKTADWEAKVTVLSDSFQALNKAVPGKFDDLRDAFDFTARTSGSTKLGSASLSYARTLRDKKLDDTAMPSPEVVSPSADTPSADGRAASVPEQRAASGVSRSADGNGNTAPKFSITAQVKAEAKKAAEAAKILRLRAEEIEAEEGKKDYFSDTKQAAYAFGQAALHAELSAKQIDNLAQPYTYWDVAGAIWKQLTNPHRVLLASQLNPAFFFMLLGLWVGLIYYADVSTTSRFGLIAKIFLGTLHFMLHVGALLIINSIVAPVLSLGVATVGIMLAIVAALLLFLIAGPVVAVALLLIATPIALALRLLPTPDWLMTFALDFFETFGFILYKVSTIVGTVLSPFTIFVSAEFLSLLFFALISILLGGLLGAFIFGIYWSIMSAVFAKHTGDAFGALGIRHYKHFLRLHFEADRLTIYPIAIDKIPGRRGWRVPVANEAGLAHNPQIVPKEPLRPYLLEAPILIEARRGAANKVPREDAEGLKENVVAAA